MCYSFGTAILLLFVYITALAVFFIKFRKNYRGGRLTWIGLLTQ